MWTKPAVAILLLHASAWALTSNALAEHRKGCNEAAPDCHEKRVDKPEKIYNPYKIGLTARKTKDGLLAEPLPRILPPFASSSPRSLVQQRAALKPVMDIKKACTGNTPECHEIVLEAKDGAKQLEGQQNSLNDTNAETPRLAEGLMRNAVPRSSIGYRPFPPSMRQALYDRVNKAAHRRRRSGR